VSGAVADSRSPRRGRLTRSADFDRVMRSGRSHAGRELVLYVFPRGGEDPPRLGLSVSRKVGGAVERNTVKRMLREAFAEEAERLPPGSDAVVIARPAAGQVAAQEGVRGIHAALEALIAKVPGVRASAARVEGQVPTTSEQPGEPDGSAEAGELPG
jgi:ribonuclease P protein component